MTILLKKKTSQGKSDGETSETIPHNNVPHSHEVSSGSVSNHHHNDWIQEEQFNTTRSCSMREEKPGTSSGIAKDSLEHYPTSNKRRHSTSPHRETHTSKHRGHLQDSPGRSCYKAGPSCGKSEDLCSGYNSGDEYDTVKIGEVKKADWLEKDKLFEKKMQKQGLMVKEMEGDGACLFRAVADQVYGDQEMHDVVRKHCMDYIAANSDYFSQYVTEDFTSYVSRKRQEYTHGNHIEMQAMSEMYNRTIKVYCYGTDPINTFHGDKVQQKDNDPIRLSYQRGSHYNSIVDPHKATIGVGLGLPNYSPGAADRSLINDAMRQNEDFLIEHAMLEDKLQATDWEATNEVIEEQVCRDSYLQWLRDSEKRKTASGKSATATSTTTVTSEVPMCKTSLSRCSSPMYDEAKALDNQSFNIIESRSFLGFVPSKRLGVSEWEDAEIMAQVLAISQQEYLDNMKKGRDAKVVNITHDQQCSDFEPIFGGPSTSS